MDATSKSYEEYTEQEREALELVHGLVRNRGFKALAELVLAARERYFENFARGLASSDKLVDQREVDYKRGFWQGALWAVRTLPKLKAGEWDKLVASMTEEVDSTG